MRAAHQRRAPITGALCFARVSRTNHSSETPLHAQSKCIVLLPAISEHKSPCACTASPRRWNVNNPTKKSTITALSPVTALISEMSACRTEQSAPATAFAHAPLPIKAAKWISTSPRRLRAPVKSCTPNNNAEIPSSPTRLLHNWTQSRSIQSTLNLSQTFVSILFLSNRCRRAAYAEKQLNKTAERYSISRRLLILSAGLYSDPGELLPWKLIAAARERDIDLSDERPCAAFTLTDLDYYDYIVVLDRNVRDKLLHMAEAYAHTSGGRLYEWERKIRLLCDFENAMPRRQRSAGTPLDVPSFRGATRMQTSMEIIEAGCDTIARSLITAGL